MLLAELPSLHCGFALAVSLALWRLGHPRAGCVWAPIVILSVIATGNHFVIDVVAGLVATLLGATCAATLHGRRRRAGSARVGF